MPLEDIKAARLEKLEHLKKTGVNPYPAKSWRTHSVAQVLEEFDALSQSKAVLALAGRIMAKREHGGATFLDIDDGSGKIQVLIKKDSVGNKEYESFGKTVDIGDILEVSGTPFITTKDERTLAAEKYRILTKSLLPLPEKWHGLQDVEERFRKRYLDLLLNRDVRKKFEMRSKIIQEIRNFFIEKDFMEVTTPTLQLLYGGASARPFKTHVHFMNIDVFLRIAPELYLKRLLVGGLEKVFEFTTNFRNEGIDRDHNPEFSGVEFYAAYKDLDWAMELTEELFERVLANIKNDKIISYQGTTVNFKRPYARATFNELLKKHAKIDYDFADEEQLKKKAQDLGIMIEKVVGKGAVADEIFKKVIRTKLIDPIFVTDYPAELLPLAKRLDESSEYVGAFQFYAGGLELIKAFSELNDPIDQRARLEAQEQS